MSIEVDVRDRILRPVAEVFAAIVEPAKMSRYFITTGSGPMAAGATVQWEFTDVGRSLSVEVKDIEVDRRIVFDWTASGARARVTILLGPGNADTTRISIREAAWPMTDEGVRRALRQTQGWTDFVCCMKAYLQHGINLRAGRAATDYNLS